eukprot:SAG31_NODE_568_length_14006_cov_4.252119_5_plen_68_part_00
MGGAIFKLNEPSSASGRAPIEGPGMYYRYNITKFNNIGYYAFIIIGYYSAVDRFAWPSERSLAYIPV